MNEDNIITGINSVVPKFNGNESDWSLFHERLLLYFKLKRIQYLLKPNIVNTKSTRRETGTFAKSPSLNEDDDIDESESTDTKQTKIKSTPTVTPKSSSSSSSAAASLLTAEEEYECADALGYTLILTRLSPAVQAKFRHVTIGNTYALYKALCDKYILIDIKTLDSARAAYYDDKLQLNENLEDYISRMNMHLITLNELKAPVNHDEFKFTFCRGLGSKYTQILSMLRLTGVTDWDKICEELLYTEAEEKRITKEAAATTKVPATSPTTSPAAASEATNFTGGNSQNKNKNKNKNKNNNTSENKSENNTTSTPATTEIKTSTQTDKKSSVPYLCWLCGESGHGKLNNPCPHKGKGDLTCTIDSCGKSGHNAAGHKARDKFMKYKEEHAAPCVEHALHTHSISDTLPIANTFELCLDSGATRTMVNRLELLENVRTTDRITFTTAKNEQPLYTNQCGDLVFTIKNDRIRLRDVYYVQHLTTNLLSVYQLKEKGACVSFPLHVNHGEIKFSDGFILKPEERGRSYYLSCVSTHSVSVSSSHSHSQNKHSESSHLVTESIVAACELPITTSTLSPNQSPSPSSSAIPAIPVYYSCRSLALSNGTFISIWFTINY